MTKLQPYAHYFIIFGLALLLLTIGQLGRGDVAWADGTKFQTVPTRTPTPEPGGGSDDDSDNDFLTDTGAVIGTVTDLSTGRPGAGITVLLNEIEVRTDTDGKYSLTGLNEGDFVVSLILEGDAVAAEEPVTVSVDGINEVVVDLAYYSDPRQAPAAEDEVGDNGDGNSASDTSQSAAQADEAAGATPTPGLATTSSNDQAADTTDADSPQTLPDVQTAVDTTTEAAASASDASDSSVDDQALDDAVPSASVAETTPQQLPVSGGVASFNWLLFVLGVGSLLLGFKLQLSKKKA